MKTSVTLIWVILASASEAMPRKAEITSEAAHSTLGMDIGVRRLLEALKHTPQALEESSNLKIGHKVRSSRVRTPTIERQTSTSVCWYKPLWPAFLPDIKGSQETHWSFPLFRHMPRHSRRERSHQMICQCSVKTQTIIRRRRTRDGFDGTQDCCKLDLY